MTTQTEALKLALEALEDRTSLMKWQIARDAVKEALAQEKALQALHDENERLGLYKDAYAQPKQKPVAWKLVPTEPTDEMLKAMDECSTEGYDERLYAGHAASVYMAAVDVAPNPPEARNQEPVAYPCIVVDVDYSMDTAAILIQDTRDYEFNNGQYWLTTTPPQRTWVGLTDKEVADIERNSITRRQAIRAIEAKLKEKNT